MNNIKRAGSLVLVLILLIATIGTGLVLAEEYRLNKSVNVYISAEDAKSGKNALKTYSAGTYNIYKRYNGMINISTTSGAGAWINPADNTVVTTTPTIPKTSDSVSSGQYKLNNSVKTYVSSDHARNRVSSTGTYYAGIYNIYKTYNGMINISKGAGPGAWINPADNKVESSTSVVVTNPTIPKTPTTNTSDTLKSGEYRLNNSVRTYVSADNARNGSSPVGTYYSGVYKIYKSYNGMLNISKVDGPGAWINPADNKTTTSTTTPTTPTITEPKTIGTPVTSTNLDKTKLVKYTARSSVNVRTGPSTSNPILTTNRYGTVIEGIQEGNWIKYNYNGVLGYTSVYYYIKVAAPATEPTTTVTPIAPSTDNAARAAKAAEIAMSKLGSSYVWGSKGPDTFDCSGLTYYSYGQVGVTLPRTSRLQSQIGRSVSYDNMLPGDLIFYARDGVVYHVAMYAGNDKIVHSTSPKDGVVVANRNDSWMKRNLYGVKRIIE